MDQNWIRRCICFPGWLKYELDTQSSIEIIHNSQESYENDILNIALNSEQLDMANIPDVTLKSVKSQTDDPLLTDILNDIQKLEDEIKKLGIRKIRRNASSQTDENLVILNSVGVQTEDPLLTDILDGIQKLDDEIKQLGIQKTKKNVSIQTDEKLGKEQKSFA